ncbi:MAG: phosphoenolpyruvate synthase [Candidatus Eisenbacteria bacterium]|nr:phosphoenolpyruvate synthase [Candidatus Eisenbacteria bacterium]
MSDALVRWLEDVGSDDVGQVGGKNASLGEMIRELKEEGVRVPGGFATTAEAYRRFIAANGIEDEIRATLAELDEDRENLDSVGRSVRRLFAKGEFPDEIGEAVRNAYRELSARNDTKAVHVAVRSSATAEDLPEASFAGQQETFLNVSGADDLLEACRRCYASLFTDRAIAYREEQGFDHMDVALSVGVQTMVRSDKSGSGVMFTIDTETGFPNVVVINAAWGLGENVVQGAVNPDEYIVFKPLLDGDHVPIVGRHLGEKERKMVYSKKGASSPTKNVSTSKTEQSTYVLADDEVLQLARWAVAIEEHYGHAMDIEWARDGDSGEMFIVQARPETVQSQKQAGALHTYTLEEKGEEIVSGLAIGEAVASGRAVVVHDVEEGDQVEEGDVLVTGMTDPDWVPLMKRAAAIVTDHGGRTSHAAIVSRELGFPAVVGTGEATELIKDGQDITVSCAQGEVGYIYKGILEYTEEEVDLENIPETDTRIMMIIASPAAAFRWWRLPARGVGLARMEFIVNNWIKVHPMALVRFDELEDRKAKRAIKKLTRGYDDKTEYFVDRLSRGIARIAASQYPDPVIVRMSDFKTNEYADLIGGAAFEPEESNPMLGFRGASRYTSDRYREGFALECRAIKRARETMGFSNVVVMIPFCRTLDEADRVLEVMGGEGLARGENGLEVYVMAEVPSNVVLASEFAKRFDGFSIGSNDLTQLTLGVDRDSEELSDIFDERDEAVKRMIALLIERAHAAGRKVGICGQAPSDHEEFAGFLVGEGIDSISLNPDSVVAVARRVAELESKGDARGGETQPRRAEPV